NLLFGKSFLHAASVWGRLYIITVLISGSRSPVPTELKIADNWTGPQLFERLEGQLAGDYLRDDASSRGIYLLVYRGKVKRWQLPGSGMVNFDELISALQKHWTSVANTHPRVEEIKVIGIDLTKRAQSPLPKKNPKSKSATNKAKEKSNTSSAAHKSTSKKDSSSRPASAKPTKLKKSPPKGKIRSVTENEE
ncbi:hypothetical protein RB24_25600, partial [Herbaspirillum rubrisubalbicans]